MLEYSSMTYLMKMNLICRLAICFLAKERSMVLMEMPELDKEIKRALLCKANEIIPSEDTFTLILAGLEKKQASRTINTSYKHYILAFICCLLYISEPTRLGMISYA